MPDSTHWLTNAQTHITGSSVLAFFMFSYSSSMRAPFSAPLRVCLTMNTKAFLGNLRCQLVLLMDAVSWAAPFAMMIAAWVVYFSAIKACGAHPLPWVWSAQSGRTRRHVNVAEVNEGEGGVSLP
ncbi:hypothetical protein B0H34DRAFT_272302 [Crassisporium funariophilum]|nr:hypothetical protein B0H34DRAFT_272302 [Crassisporium funariophilum]